MGIFNRFKRNDEEKKLDRQKKEVLDTNPSEISLVMEQKHEIEDIVEEKEIETTISDTNADYQEEKEDGETVPIDTTEMVEQLEEEGKEKEVKEHTVEVNGAEVVKEEVHISIHEEQDVVDVSIIEMEDIPDTETELVDPLVDSSKKYYSDVKLSILEKRLDTLLHTKKQLLSNPKPDNKKLEEIVLCIQTIKSEIEDTKYEAFRFSSEI